ncbi:hypothetical protein Patl1_11931 [Pistacia atlantica]|uniref:Uncharacterized protein n=1 Tax=Pistacia atlantica TaxID=434234 RepID=A0ACC1AA58_9ROSI|nr:hypothetical protein Patl1_11931 [Pistacia atlantica]
MNLPNLEVLALHVNMLQGSNYHPLYQNAKNCNTCPCLSIISQVSIPKEIESLTQLKGMYLGDNKLQGEIPKGAWQSENTGDIITQNNSLMGTIPSLIFNLSSLIFMDFSNNSLSGSLPENMCQRLPNLETLSMSHNQLTGPIPHSLGQ